MSTEYSVWLSLYTPVKEPPDADTSAREVDACAFMATVGRPVWDKTAEGFSMSRVRQGIYCQLEGMLCLTPNNGESGAEWWQTVVRLYPRERARLNKLKTKRRPRSGSGTVELNALLSSAVRKWHLYDALRFLDIVDKRVAVRGKDSEQGTQGSAAEEPAATSPTQDVPHDTRKSVTKEPALGAVEDDEQKDILDQMGGEKLKKVRQGRKNTESQQLMQQLKDNADKINELKQRGGVGVSQDWVTFRDCLHTIYKDIPENEKAQFRSRLLSYSARLSCRSRSRSRGHRGRSRSHSRRSRSRSRRRRSRSRSRRRRSRSRSRRRRSASRSRSKSSRRSRSRSGRSRSRDRSSRGNYGRSRSRSHYARGRFSRFSHQPTSTPSMSGDLYSPSVSDMQTWHLDPSVDFVHESGGEQQWNGQAGSSTQDSQVVVSDFEALNEFLVMN